MTGVKCEECGEREAKIYFARDPRPAMLCYACWCAVTPVTPEEEEAFLGKAAAQRG